MEGVKNGGVEVQTSITASDLSILVFSISFLMQNETYVIKL